MTKGSTNAVRLKDIAQDLNVSVMTVSKVVRGCADVGAETRKRVEAKVKELNYQPNWVARSLAARRTFIIGLIVPDLIHSFFGEIAKSVAAAIRPLGYDVVICNSEEDPAAEASEVERLLGRQVDGLLLASANSAAPPELFEKMEARGVPCVLIDRQFEDVRSSFVGNDDHTIGRMAVGHLIERGCRKIVHIAGPPTTTSMRRESAYRETLAEVGLECKESYVIHATDHIDAYLLTKKLLESGLRPDGIFGYNDPNAGGALKAVLEFGMAVPGDVKVIGVGNVRYTDLLRVPLSTIDQNSTSIGEQAADLLIKSIGAKRKRALKSVMVEPRLIQRESTR